MMTRRKNQALQLNKRKATPDLKVVPRSVVSAAEQSVLGVRRDLLRNIDFHPALTVLTGVGIVALVCVIYLGQVSAVTNANYTLQALRSEHTRLLQERQDLQLQIAAAQSLQRIEETARARLGMVPIGDKYEYVTIAPGPIQSMEPAGPGLTQQPATDQPLAPTP
jgi:cell division protein FtsL